MENFINWVDLGSAPRSRRGTAVGLEISIYQNKQTKTAGNKGNYMTFSQELRERYEGMTFVKIGLIGEKIIFKFNHSDGIKINRNEKNPAMVRVSSGKLVEMVFSKYSRRSDCNTSVYTLIDMGNDTFVIDQLKPGQIITTQPTLNL